MLISALIILGVLYLITMWATNLLAPNEEQATPAAPPNVLMERALTASEKVLAEQATQSRELGALRKQVESMQGQNRRAGGHGSAGGEASDAAQDKRLDEMERRLDDIRKALPSQLLARLEKLEKDATVHSAAPATQGQPDVDPQLAARVEKLEKELGARPAAAVSRPVAQEGVDPQVSARLDRLEKALAAHPAPAAVDTGELTARLDRLEKALAARPAPAAADTGELVARLAKLERALAHQATQAKSEPKTETRPAAKAKTARAEADPRKISHKVKPGETLVGLARRYKVSVDDLLHWNAGQLGDRRLLFKGETLVIYPGSNS